MNSSSSSTTAEWVFELLAGFRYLPDEEQMLNLLKKKMEGKLDSQASQIMPESGYQTWEPGNRTISLFLHFLTEMMQGKFMFLPEIDVLKSEPWDLPGRMFPDSPYQAREWLAFSRPNHININSRSCHRRTKQGSWKPTGDPREIKSQKHSFTCKKRTLTFHIRGESKPEKTDWVMHEYFPTETKLGSSCFVLVRLKKNSVSKKRKDTPIASNSGNQPAADAINHVNPAPKELLAHNEPEDVQFGSGDDHDDKMQQPPVQVSPFPTPKLPQPPLLGNAPDVSNNEFSNCKDQAAAVMTPESQDYRSSTLQSPAHRGLGIVLQANGTIDDCTAMQSPFGYTYYSVTHKNDTSTCDDGEPHSSSASNFETQSANDSFRELSAQPVKDLDRLQIHVTQQPPAHTKLGDVMHIDVSNDVGMRQSPFRDNDPYVTHKNNISTNDDNEPVSYNASDFENQAANYRILQPHQPHDYSTSLPHADVYNDEFSEWLSTFLDSDSYLTDKKNISTNDDDQQVSNTASNFVHQATDDRILQQVCPPPEENLELLFPPPQPEDCTVQPLMQTDVEDVLHDNNYIEWNDFQVPIWRL